MPRKDVAKPVPRTEAPTPPDDLVLVHGKTEDGEGLAVLRKRGSRIEAGEVRPLVEGKPLSGEVVRLRPRSDTPYLADVEVLHAPEPVRSGRSGPAQVATPAYREGFRAIFGSQRANAKPDTRLN